VSRQIGLAVVAREWTRIGVTGFGGPPAHIALLRSLVVDRRGWMDAREFEDANAACGLLPGPASTQMAIFCAYRVAGRPGAVIGGLGFVAPAVVMILALSVLFLSASPPEWVRALGAGAAGAVPAVAVHAGLSLLRPSYRRARTRLVRWLVYVVAGGAAAIVVAPYLVLVLLGCGAIELIVQRRLAISTAAFNPGILAVAVGTGGLLSLAWVAFKVGALSYGGGFVIIPLMQGDAVHTYHWMTDAQFLNAVALGQVTPGPVVATVAAVGYAAHGIGGGLLAAVVAFVPSFSFILLGGGRFERLRANTRARAFLDGAGPAAIGAIFGAAVTLSAALHEDWQYAVLAAAVVALLAMRRSVVATLVGAALVGGTISALGGPIP
jgi:chromate transporter